MMVTSSTSPSLTRESPHFFYSVSLLRIGPFSSDSLYHQQLSTIYPSSLVSQSASFYRQATIRNNILQSMSEGDKSNQVFFHHLYCYPLFLRGFHVVTARN